MAADVTDVTASDKAITLDSSLSSCVFTKAMTTTVRAKFNSLGRTPTYQELQCNIDLPMVHYF